MRFYFLSHIILKSQIFPTILVLLFPNFSRAVSSDGEQKDWKSQYLKLNFIMKKMRFSFLNKGPQSYDFKTWESRRKMSWQKHICFSSKKFWEIFFFPGLKRFSSNFTGKVNKINFYFIWDFFQSDYVILTLENKILPPENGNKFHFRYHSEVIYLPISVLSLLHAPLSF